MTPMRILRFSLLLLCISPGAGCRRAEQAPKGIELEAKQKVFVEELRRKEEIQKAEVKRLRQWITELQIEDPMIRENAVREIKAQLENGKKGVVLHDAAKAEVVALLKFSRDAKP